jgi:N-acyl-D-aspartate/D-glutamate deacylase
VISLREFIERSSSVTAKWFGLTGRGELKPGAFADVVVFDPKTYAAQATYEQPTLPATGVKTVVVNGKIAVDNGKLTGSAAGRALPHTPKARTCG